MSGPDPAHGGSGAQEPRRVVDRYAAGEGSDDGGEPKAFVSVNWVLTEQPLDLETELVGLTGLGLL